ncbi:hypothetical protein EDC04DRAFT_2894489 [Pisolithus marmoratus]|nr:hypothetical protein EDC04DRAFT_2894489 [Pisolithus marmoratus]
MPNGTSCGNTFTPGTSTLPTGAVHHVADHSPALDGETALDTPDLPGCSLNINDWCEMLPRDNPPHPTSISSVVISNMPSSKVSAPPPSSAPPSSVRTSDMQSIKVHPPTPLSTIGKQAHSKMTGNDDAISALLFVNASDIDTVTSSSKCLQLSTAMDHARNSSSCHSHKAPAVSDPVVVGLQGTINYLTSSIHTLMTLPLTTRTQALQLLDTEDQAFPRPLRAFIQSLIAQSLGFADVYIGMTNKDDQLEYVELEYQLKFGTCGSQRNT